MSTRRLQPHNPMPESRYEVLALFTFAMVGASLFIMATGTLMPFLETAFHLSQTQLGLVLSVQMAGSLAMTAVAGMFTDRFGDKAVVLWTGVLMGVALIAGAAVENFSWLLAWLLLYGIGFAAVTPAGSHAIIFFFTKEQRGLAMGVRQCGIPTAGVIGSILLPAVALHFDYQWALVAAGILTIVACAAASFLYREPKELQGERISLLAMIGEMLTIARDTRLVFMTLVSMALVCSQLAVMAFLTLTIAHEAAYGIELAVALFTLSQVAAIVGRIFWGWISDAAFHGSRALPLAVDCVITAGAAFAFSSFTPSTPLWVAGVVVVVLGFAAEGWFGIAVLGIAEIGGEEHSGSALGISLSWVYLAGFITPMLFGALAQIYGYPFAWRGIAIVALLGIWPALLASVYIRNVAAAARSAS
ncbi:MAG TPA: MFS transporter [Candidatus Baltobacteraceae bacterium]|nr:MFS transporter [Candidatus Baltobacteraceae bacterium]